MLQARKPRILQKEMSRSTHLGLPLILQIEALCVTAMGVACLWVVVWLIIVEIVQSGYNVLVLWMR